MYRPSAFAVDDVPVLHDVIRNRVFATVTAVIDDAVHFAYAPVILDAANGALGGIRFHLAIGNPLAKLEAGVRMWISVMAADAYISPDWYRVRSAVPTWNYIAVEGEGHMQRTSREELRQLVVDLSAQEEVKLLPKEPWLLDKVPAEKAEMLMSGIAGFVLPFEKLSGKFKLSQNKTSEDFGGVITRLEARGDAASAAVADAMKRASK